MKISWVIILGTLVSVSLVTAQVTRKSLPVQSKKTIKKPRKKVEAMLKISSPSFEPGQPLKSIHSWKAGNEAPTLEWSNVPDGTQSFVLISDDPDAPGKIWVHWVVYNVPAKTRELSQPLGRKRQLPDGTMQGMNDFEKIGYDGPFPPIGKPHRYYFKLYALDTMLKLEPGATKQEVEKAMQGHVLGSGQIMGTYARTAEKK